MNSPPLWFLPVRDFPRHLRHFSRKASRTATVFSDPQIQNGEWLYATHRPVEFPPTAGTINSRRQFMSGLIHARRQNLAAKPLVMSLDGGSELALARRCRLLIVFAGAQFGKQPGFLHGALEASQCDLKRLVFLYSDRRHRIKYFPYSC